MKDSLTEFNLTESKIAMLYILNKAGANIAYRAFLELVTSLTSINYFDFHQVLQILQNENYIIKNEKLKTEYESEKNNAENTIIYSLSDEGKQVIDAAIGLLPGIKKLTIDAEFDKKYRKIKQELSVSAEYIPNKNLVICKAKDQNTTLIDLNLYITNGEHAKRIVRNWNEKADKLYLEILEKISKDSNDLTDIEE